MSSPSVLRTGVIGIGLYAYTSLVPQLRATGKTEVSAIARRNPERLALLKKSLDIPAAYTDWREMLEQEPLGAVIISTPHSHHTEPALAALKRGLHVFVEKPLALTSADAWAIVRAAERAGKVLSVGYNVRGQGLWRAAKQKLEEGVIGKLRLANLVYCVEAAWILDGNRIPAFARRDLASEDEALRLLASDFVANARWRGQPEVMGGGMFVDIGSHATDALLWLTGAPLSVSAATENAKLEVDTFVSVQARLANRILATCAFGADVAGGDVSQFGPGRLTIAGDDGLLVAEWAGLNPMVNTKIWIERNGTREPVEPILPDIAPIAAFVETVVDGAPNLSPGAEAAHTVAFTEAVYRSAETNQVVSIAAQQA